MGNGSALMAFGTTCADLPTTDNAISTTLIGGLDCYLCELDKGYDVKFGSYLGSSGDEGVNCMDYFDGIIALSGTQDGTFGATEGAYDTTKQGQGWYLAQMLRSNPRILSWVYTLP